MTKDQAIAELDKRGPKDWKDDDAAMWVLEVLEQAGAFTNEETRAITVESATPEWIAQHDAEMSRKAGS